MAPRWEGDGKGAQRPSRRRPLSRSLRSSSRIVEVEQDNKMTSSNLGIVFGPTLLRPRPTDATISLSSLVDYPHQARVIEALIIFYPTIFEDKDSKLTAEGSEFSADREEDTPVRALGREQPGGGVKVALRALPHPPHMDPLPAG